MNKNNFKKCPKCGTVWLDRESFLDDPELQAIGYQVDFEDLELGLFYFNHHRQGCRTTLAVHARFFTDLYKGEIFHERLTGTEACPGHCLYHEDLDPCPLHCECAYVRETLQIIKGWPKKNDLRD